MNSVHEQLSKQCTGSKTGLGAPGAHPYPRQHEQHGLGAVSWRQLGRVLAPSSAVSWPSPAVSQA